MQIQLPGEVAADSVELTLDDGRYVEVSGDGAVRVYGLDRGEYTLALPSVEQVAAQCDAREDAYANGHMTITVEHRH